MLHYDIQLLGEITMLFTAASIGGVVATMVQFPLTVGYIGGGAVVGPSVFGLVRQYTELETISLLGTLFLLFGKFLVVSNPATVPVLYSTRS